MMAPVGYFTFLLHTHIPQVLGHGVWPHGSHWLMEAAVETYIPLMENLFRLRAEGGRCPITVSLTPVLMDQLTSPAFGPMLRAYIDEKIAAADKNEAAFTVEGQRGMAGLAGWWRDFYLLARNAWDSRYATDPLGTLKALASDFGVELIPSAVTHAYLPLLGSDPCVRAQVAGAVRAYERVMGSRPAGFWLPECGFRPADHAGGPRRGIDEVLAASGISYFVTDQHMLTGRGGGGYGYRAGFISGGAPAPLGPLRAAWDDPAVDPMLPLEPYTLAATPRGALAVFARDRQASLQVWSHEFGYPGAGEYLEFHKKHNDGGLRYWRVTDRHRGLEDKAPYDPHVAAGIARMHAAHFAGLVRSRLETYAAAQGRPGTMVAPFDTELFGHWWFEGPIFLAEVLRLLPRAGVEVRTCVDQLALAPPRKSVDLFEGSWGEGGDHRMWLNMHTVHMWEEIHRSEEAFTQIVARHAGTTDLLLRRVLKQMARTLMLIESSDWLFLVTTATARDYAEERFTRLLHHFKMLKAIAAVALGRGELGEKEIEQLEGIEKDDALLRDTDLLDDYR